MHLDESTWSEADSIDGSVAVLPVGSTEQHGPQAPLGTDTFAASAIAAEGVERAKREVVIGPEIPVGVAAEHRQFTGTLWVSEDTFRSYVGETIESLVSHGWDRVVVVNGHGGNVSPLREICGNLVRDDVCYAVPFTWFDAIDPESIDASLEGMGHGGALETSLMQYLQPALVREDRFDEARDGGASRWGEWESGVNLAYDSAEFSESGVVGDPGASSPELGEQLLAASAEKLATLLDTVAERDVSRPSHV